MTHHLCILFSFYPQFLRGLQKTAANRILVITYNLSGVDIEYCPLSVQIGKAGKANLPVHSQSIKS